MVAVSVVRPAPWPYAVFVNDLFDTSDVVIVWVFVQLTDPPIARVVAAGPQSNGVPLSILSSDTWNWLGPSGAFPELVRV